MARRLLAAGDAERERIERDLHDGLQQHLTTLRIRLDLAADRFRERGDTNASAVLTGFGADVDDAIAELRNFARGVYPALLATGGLGAALASAARSTTGPVTVRAHALRRCRPDVEAAVYFTCLAALDNVAKHAGPAQVSIVLSDSDDALRFSVTDSGSGFEAGGHRNAGAGTGITNMHDRIAAIGGTLTIDSAVGQGTRVRGTVPALGFTSQSVEARTGYCASRLDPPVDVAAGYVLADQSGPRRRRPLRACRALDDRLALRTVPTSERR